MSGLLQQHGNVSGKGLDIINQRSVLKVYSYLNVKVLTYVRGLYSHEVNDNMTFEEKGGKTTLVEWSTYSSMKDRDGMIESGINIGLCDRMNCLSELISSIKKEK